MLTHKDIFTHLPMMKAHVSILVKDGLWAETMLLRLQKSGFLVSIHNNLESLYKLFDRGDICHAIIIDVDYYDLSSLELGRYSDSIKVFALSDHDTMEKRLQAAQFDAVALLSKPLDASCLSNKLKEQFGLSDEKIYDVLVVDDDPFILKLCQKFFESHKLRVRFVENPMDVLSELEQRKPDLILLDYYMPNANGVDVEKVIRQIYKTEELPVLFMTGSSDEKVLSDIRERTILRPISKPFIREDFMNHIFSVLQIDPKSCSI